jgi:predicted nucleotidyltransferase
MTGMVDGRAWISGLPPRLERQGRALTELLELCEGSPSVTSLSVGCSLGRGAGDELSDVDAAVGVAAPRGAAGADLVRAVEQELVERLSRGRLLDVLRQESLTGDLFLRRLFVQLVDGVQLDLAVIAEAEVRRGEAAPDFVPVYRAGDPVEPVAAPSAQEVREDQVHDWAFLGWRALLDAHKYLRRGSRWEAHERLHEARHHVWALWAAAQGATYPWHGLSQVLDHDPSSLPPGIEATVAGLDPEELRRAVLATASVLDAVAAAAARRCPTELPTAMAGHVRAALADLDAGLDADTDA